MATAVATIKNFFFLRFFFLIFSFYININLYFNIILILILIIIACICFFCLAKLAFATKCKQMLDANFYCANRCNS